MICEQAEFVHFTKQVTFGLNVREMVMFESRPVHAGFVGLSGQIPRVDVFLDYETDVHGILRVIDFVKTRDS
jgi:hypothetical protein